MRYKNLVEVRRANADAGQYWFSPDTLRFFNSRFPDGQRVYGGRFFVSAETGPDEVERYSIREALRDGSVETVGDFQAFGTINEARIAAQGLVRSDD